MPFRDSNGMFCERSDAVWFTQQGMRYRVTHSSTDPIRGYIHWEDGTPVDTLTGWANHADDDPHVYGCANCGWRGSAIEFLTDPQNGRRYCRTCFQPCQHGAAMDSMGYVVAPGPCHSRGVAFDETGLVLLCQSHLDERPHCERCQGLVTRESSHYCVVCNAWRCGDMRSRRTRNGRTVWRCMVCARNGAALMSYGAVPNVVIFRSHRGVRSFNTDGERHSYPHAPDDALYLGLELETELDGTPGSSGDDDDYDDDDYYGSGEVDGIVTAWHATGLGWSTSDGSLRNGAECKTHPSTYQWLRRDDRLRLACFRLVDAGARAWSFDSTGLHTHVSMAAFARPSLLYRFAWLQVSAMRRECERLSGRQNAHYAMWPGANYQSPLPILAGKEGKRDRSVALNVNADTLELRYWKGTVTGSSVIGQCAFIDALYQYAPVFADSDATGGNVNWDTFSTWATRALPASQVRDIAQLCANRHQSFPLALAPEREM